MAVDWWTGKDGRECEIKCSRINRVKVVKIPPIMMFQIIRNPGGHIRESGLIQQ